MSSLILVTTMALALGGCVSQTYEATAKFTRPRATAELIEQDKSFCKLEGMKATAGVGGLAGASDRIKIYRTTIIRPASREVVLPDRKLLKPMAGLNLGCFTASPEVYK